MRLLNTTPPLLAKEFNESELPAYAILSHTWENEEVLFSDLPLLPNSAESNPVHEKVLAFCAEARAQGYRYAWIDTCCIDKTSTMELSEAINSMYRWYQKAGTCFAYLSDYEAARGSLQNCRWFKRGWTLQELIAPREIEFYGRNWTLIGTKSQLRSTLSTITGIEEGVLVGASPETCSIAERMSWAAGRETARKEDRAYSLLGLFDVNLPLIYGASETRNAFILLQEEIIKHSDDQTIFVWGKDISDHGRGHCGLLANSPDAFADCSGVIRSPSSGLNPRGFGLTNVGLTVSVKIHPYDMHTYFAMFDCTYRNSPRKRRGVLLEMLADESQYARVRVNGITTVTTDLIPDYIPDLKVCQICVQQNPGPRLNYRYGFWIRTLRPPGFSDEELRQAKIWPRAPSPNQPHECNFVEIPPGCSGTAGMVYLPLDYRHSEWWEMRWLKVAFDKDFNPVCILGNQHSLWGDREDNLALNYKALAATATSASNSAARLDPFHSEWLSGRNAIQFGEYPLHNKYQDYFHDDGICILEGKRGRSLYMKIYGLNLSVSMQLEQCSAPPLDPEGYTGSSWRIWTLDVTEITMDDGDVPATAFKLYIAAKKRAAKKVLCRKGLPYWINC